MSPTPASDVIIKRIDAFVRDARAVPLGTTMTVRLCTQVEGDARPWIVAEAVWQANKDAMSGPEIRHEAQSFIDCFAIDLGMAPYCDTMVETDARHPRHYAMKARVFGPVPLHAPVFAGLLEAAE